MNRISCENAQRLMPLYQSGELAGDSLNDLCAHMAVCAGCLREAERQMALDRVLRDEMPVDQTAANAIARSVGWRIGRQLWTRRLAIAAGGLAAAAVLLLTYVVTQQMARPLVAAARDHRTEVVQKQPRRWVGAEGVAALCLRAGLPVSPAPDLSAAGYQLRGARLCRLDGKIWLHLVYQGPEREVSVFLKPNDDHGPTRMMTMDDISVGAFTLDNVRVSLVSEAEEECRSLATRLRNSRL